MFLDFSWDTVVIVAFDKWALITGLSCGKLGSWSSPASSAFHTFLTAAFIFRTSFWNDFWSLPATWPAHRRGWPTLRHVERACSSPSRGIKQAWRAVKVANLRALYFEVALVWRAARQAVPLWIHVKIREDGGVNIHPLCRLLPSPSCKHTHSN